MTTYNKTSLKTFFETGDVPDGSNYADFIDSCVNLAETAEQSMGGALNTTELITARVSAGDGVFTAAMKISGTTSAADVYANTVRGSAAVFGILQTGVASFTDISVNDLVANGVIASAVRQGTGIVSAAGSSQATAAPLLYTINIGAGVADGQSTGFILPSNRTGLAQYVINGAASANLWPCVGGQINVLSSNAAFGMAANTLYTVIHTRASGYAVK